MMNFGFGGVWMIVFWVILIAAIVLAIKALTGKSHRDPTPHTDSPMEVLKRRYAAGEISQEEYESKKRDLIRG